MIVEWTWTGTSLPSLKNSKQIFKKKNKAWKIVPFISSSDNYKAWNVLFVRDIRTLKPIWKWIRAKFTFCPPDNQRVRSTQQIWVHSRWIKRCRIHYRRLVQILSRYSSYIWWKIRNKRMDSQGGNRNRIIKVFDMMKKPNTIHEYYL